MGDHQKGQVMGRIYRVAQSAASSQPPKLDVTTAAGAVAALKSPNPATQYLAWQALHKMGAQAEADLLTLWKSEDPRLRARALGLLAQIKGNETKHLTAGLSDADSDVRVFAVRLAKMLSTSRGFDTTPLEENKEVMGKLMRDPSPQVRRQIALALSGTKEIAKIWSALAQQHDGKDRWYLEALGIGARGNEEECFTEWLAAVGDQWNTPAGRDIIWRLRTSRTAEFLAKIIADPNAGTEKLRYVRAFDFLPQGSEKTTALVQLAALGKESEEIAVEALQRLKDVDLSRHTQAHAALENLLASTRGTARYVDLVRDFKVKGQSAGLLEFIEKAPGSQRQSRLQRLCWKMIAKPCRRRSPGRKPRGCWRRWAILRISVPCRCCNRSSSTQPVMESCAVARFARSYRARQASPR
jgi:HEAT repeat protein